MSGSDKMEVDGAPPPLVFDDEDAKGQDAKTPDSEEKKKLRGRGGYERTPLQLRCDEKLSERHGHGADLNKHNKEVHRTQVPQRLLSAPHNSAVSTWRFRGAKSLLLRSHNFCTWGIKV